MKESIQSIDTIFITRLVLPILGVLLLLFVGLTSINSRADERLANDARIQSEMESVVTQIERGIAKGAVGNVTVTTQNVDGQRRQARIEFVGVDEPRYVPLSGGSNISTLTPQSIDDYILYGSHENGQEHNSDFSQDELVYNKASGGFSE